SEIPFRAVSRPASRRVLGLLFAVLLPLSLVSHSGDEGFAREGYRLGAHHHGPHDPCPEGTAHHCLACSSYRLFGAPPSWRLPLPVVSNVFEVRRHESRAARVVSPREVGRSPPSSVSV